MVATITTTIDGLSPKVAAARLKKAANSSIRDVRARQVITNTIKKFFTGPVNTTSFGSAYNAVNTTLTLKEIGVVQDFSNINHLRDAMLTNRELTNQVVVGVRKKLKTYFSTHKFDGNTRHKHLPINTGDITIGDIDFLVEFRNGKATIVATLTPAAMNRFLDKAYRKNKDFNFMVANNASKAYLKYITNLTRKSKNVPDYFSKLFAVARDLQGKVYSFRTIVSRLKMGPNTITLSRVGDMNQILSEYRWTELVQKRLRDTTEKYDRVTNPAEPPDLKKRSGRFISSVRVTPNNQGLMYKFLGYYRHNEKFGYKVDKQVTDAIQWVAKERFMRDFGLNVPIRISRG